MRAPQLLVLGSLLALLVTGPFAKHQLPFLLPRAGLVAAFGQGSLKKSQAESKSSSVQGKSPASLTQAG